jgi:hypothetical protein
MMQQRAIGTQKMWEIDHFIKGAESEDRLVTALINDQKVRIEWIGGRESINRFSYRDGPLMFEFSASRYGLSDGLLKDKITVYLGMALHGLSKVQKSIQNIKHNIESAFLAWPPAPIEKDIPLNGVVFNMDDPSS